MKPTRDKSDTRVNNNDQFQTSHMMPPTVSAHLIGLQQEDSKLSIRSPSDIRATDETQISYELLRDAYMYVTHQLVEAKQEITDHQKSVGYPIPRRVYDELQAKYENLEKEHEHMLFEFKMLNYDLQKLMDAVEKLVRERNDYREFALSARGSCTPRPDWKKCANMIDGGHKRWTEISADKSSNELVDVLLNELVGGNDPSSNLTHLSSLGTGLQVPKYLRYYGDVKNLHFPKRLVLQCIRDIWQDRIQSQQQAEKKSLFTDFVYDHFAAKFGDDRRAYEWSYNLHAGCKRYLADERINLFYSILLGDVDEGVYIYEQAEIARLTRNIFAAHLNSIPKLAARVELEKPFIDGDTPFTKEMLLDMLQYTFPGKNKESLSKLMKVAVEEAEAFSYDLIDYNKILTQNDENQLSRFLNLVVAQIREEKTAYCAKIMNEMQTSEQVSPADLAYAICKADEDIPTNEVDRYLQWVFKKDVTNTDRGTTLPLATVVAVLERGSVWNHSSFNNNVNGSAMNVNDEIRENTQEN